MQVGIMQSGEIDRVLLERVKESLEATFSGSTFAIIDEEFLIPKEAFNQGREQFRSDLVMAEMRKRFEKLQVHDRILVVLDKDIFVPPLSFVFGQAECPGKIAIVSLFRLKPEFYKRKTDANLLMERTFKEAVHELGHTLGMEHCSNPFCVMHFSNTIFDTDRKQSLFCSKCDTRIEATMTKQKKEF